MVKKKEFLILEGNVFNLGSKEKNIASVRRKIRNNRFKGRFKIKLGKTPKSNDAFVKFEARRLEK